MIGEENRIDSVKSLDSGIVMLAILDDWDWQDVPAHLTALQAKVNHYLERVLTGALQQEFPNLDPQAYGFTIWLLLKEEYLPREAVKFLSQLRHQLRGVGGELELSFEDPYTAIPRD